MTRMYEGSAHVVFDGFEGWIGEIICTTETPDGAIGLVVYTPRMGDKVAYGYYLLGELDENRNCYHICEPNYLATIVSVDDTEDPCDGWEDNDYMAAMADMVEVYMEDRG